MSFSRRTFVSCLAAAPASAWASMPLEALASTTPPSVAAFAAVPIRTVSLSPDGQRLAWVDASSSRPAITVMGIDGRPLGDIPIPDNIEVNRIYWADQNWVLIEIGFYQKLPGERISRDWTRTLALNVATRRINRVESGALNSDFNLVPVAFVPGPTPKALVLGIDFSAEADRFRRVTGIGSSFRRIYALSAFEIELGTNRSREVARGTPDTDSFAFLPDGKPLLRFDTNFEARTTIVWKAGSGMRWEKLLDLSDGTFISQAGMLDPQTALVYHGPNRAAVLKRLDVATGKLDDAIPGETRPIISTITDRHDGMIAGVIFDALGRVVRWLRPELEQAQARLDRSFAGKMVSIISWNAARTKFLALVDDPSAPTGVLLFNTADGSAQWVGDENAEMSAYTFGPRQLMTLKARDNLELTTIVTFPPGKSRSSGPMPVVMLPHGGPHSEDDPGFDPWAHLFAAHGMVVLQPQFRGSTGFGRAFRDLGTGEWGGKMQTDLDDTLAWAVAQGFADPRRAAIVGASYGGYAALMAATRTPDLYRCAVSIAGVSDIRAFLEHARRRSSGGRGDGEIDWQTEGVWLRMMGFKAFDPQGLMAISPVSEVGATKAPVLLLHGALDLIVPFSQSRIMADALAAAGKPHRLVELPGEDHYLRKQASRERVYADMLAFVREHLGV